MIRRAVAASAVSFLLAVPTLASAHEPAPAGIIPMAAAPARESDVTEDLPSGYVEGEREASGFVLDLRLASLLVPAGKWADVEGADLGSFGAGIGAGLILGDYITPHFGITGGVRFSYKHQGVSGCDPNKDHCGGYTLQVPVMFQYALQNRKKGLYFEAGFGLKTTYVIYGETPAGFVNLTLSNDWLEYKTGIGYRIPLDGKTHVSRYGMDIYADADFGQFSNVSVSGGSSNGASGAIEHQAYHAMFQVGVAIHFTP